jgi:zinc protease
LRRKLALKLTRNIETSDASPKGPLMPINLRRSLPAFALAGALLGASALSPVALAQAPSSAAQAVWAQDRTDVKPDPRLRFGVLPNGMRYVLMQNATPPGQVSLRLHMNVGSLMETDKEAGLAHFIEHSTFDGTTHVKPHEIIKILERHGLAFGPDTNAQTNFDQTVYQLDLPKSDAETVDTGLFLMRETAGEVDFDKAAFENERGVVLAEERSRDGPSMHVAHKSFDFRFEGQLVPKRFPIGDTEVIKTAPRERLMDFYHRYYRPERATLVAVGDFDVDAMEKKIRDRFSDWKAVGPAGADPVLGAIKARGEETKLVVEPGSQSAVTVSWLSPPEIDRDSVAYRKQEFLRSLGFRVMDRRFEKIARAADAPFLGAGAGRSTEYRSADVVSVSATLNPAKFAEGVKAIETEVKRAAEYGVTQAELDREITDMRAAFKTAASSEATRKTPGLADEIAESVNGDEVFTSPSQDLALFEEAVKGVDAKAVSAELKAEFSGVGPLVFAMSPTPVDGGEKMVAAAFDEAKLAQVTPPANEVAKAWAYTDFGPAGQVVETREAPDLDATMVRFANGVRLTVKPTKFHKDEILVSVRAGQGRLDEPRDRTSQMWALMQGLYIEGGLKDLTAQEIDQALIGKVVGANFGVDDNAFIISGGTRSEDFATQMQLLAAYLTSPGWRGEAWSRYKTYGLTLRQQLEAEPSGVYSRESAQLLRSGDKRWTFPSQAEIQAADLAELKRFVSEGLATGPIEVTIVGDISVDEAVQQTAATFGALPPRPAAVPRPSEAREVRFPAGTPEPVRLTHKGRADQAIALVAWPTVDFPSDPQRARQAHMLELVLQLRMVDVLRQKEGITYSPQAMYNASWDYPGYGYIAALMEAPPEKLDGFFRDLASIAKDLGEAPVTADELQRALKPEIERIERDKASNNGYWLSALSRAQTDPRFLDAIRSSIPGLQRVTPAQIQAAAQAYLKDDKAYKLVIAPETKVASSDTVGASVRK